MFADHLLSWVTFLPLLASLVLLVLPKGSDKPAKMVALVALLVDFVLSLGLLRGFDPDGGMQFVERLNWLPSLGINYSMGIDGISLWLVLLTTFLGPIIVLSAWNSIEKRSKEFAFFFLMLQTAMLGTFCAQDMVLFYVFWEAMLLPMALMIGIWGGTRRIYAAVKFVLYTAVGSLLMLAAILYMYSKTGGSFAMEDFRALTLSVTEQGWLFGAFALAFCIKVPLFPLHTWLPDAHVEAPTAGSVVLAGVMLKLGTYGLLRFALPFFPEAVDQFAPLLCGLAVAGIIYGALVAMVQPDIKKLVAYSSVSHLGFVVLGIFALTPEALAGAIFVMLAHGLSTGMLFLLVGVIYERRHTRKISDFGGLAHIMPLYTVAFMIATFASVGLPGMSGFVGEFLVLLGTFTSTSLGSAQVFAALAATGVILGAVYMLWMVQRVFFGPNDNPANHDLKDMSLREVVVVLPLAILILVMGVYPKPWLNAMEPAIQNILEQHESALATGAIDTSLEHPIVEVRR